jgi:hypothetical protein
MLRKESETFRRVAQMRLNAAQTEEKAAEAVLAAAEQRKWAKDTWARLDAQLEANRPRYNLSADAAKLAEQFGMVPEGDLRDTRKVKVSRDNQDNTTLVIPGGRGDRLERNMRFAFNTPAPAM